MESFLTTLPPYVHQYINKYPPTECFNVLKELVCFAVLYSNDREHMNLLSLGLLEKRADRVLVHHPYASSTLNGSTLTSKQALRASPTPMDSVTHQLSPTTTIAPGNKSPLPSIKSTTTTTNRNSNKHQHTTMHLDHGCQPVLKENTAKIDVVVRTPPQPDTTTTEKPSNNNRKSTMPSVFPDWWGHPDTAKSDDLTDSFKKAATLRCDSPVSNERPPMTKTQEMNITNWIPINYENTKPSGNQTSRPISVHNPTIPDLRSYLGPTSNQTKKSQTQQLKDSSKASRRMSVPLCESPRATTPSDPSQKDTTRSSTTMTADTANNRSSFRPGQTATVRARAEAARQRQLQLEEEKRKLAAAKQPSRTHLRMKQQAVSSMDWDAIKKDRRKTMPATGYSN